MNDAALMNGEWVYTVNADDVIAGKAMSLSISPDTREKAALSKRLNIHKIDSLSAEMTLKRNAGNMFIHVQGRIKAQVQQKCIVTLEPVSEVIDETFESWFADHTQAVSFNKVKRERMNLKEKDEQPIMEEHEDPEAIIDGKIDLGELAAQYLSLSLNPFPRAADAHFENGDDDIRESAPEGSYNNPFAALKDWKIKESKKDK